MFSMYLKYFLLKLCCISLLNKKKIQLKTPTKKIRNNFSNNFLPPFFNPLTKKKSRHLKGKTKVKKRGGGGGEWISFRNSNPLEDKMPALIGINLQWI